MAILMPHQDCKLNITAQDIQHVSAFKDHRGHILVLSRFTVAGCRLWASKRESATFTVGVNALWVIQRVKKMTFDVQGGRLSEVETGLMPKSGPLPK